MEQMIQVLGLPTFIVVLSTYGVLIARVIILIILTLNKPKGDNTCQKSIE